MGMSSHVFAPPDAPLALIYRDRIVPRSEAQFMRRQYVGFSRMRTAWVGCGTDAGLRDLGVDPLILGGPGPVGRVRRALFKQAGVVPDLRLLRAMEVRIVHAQFGRGGALALPIARALGVPLVVTFHGGDATKATHYRRRLLPTAYQRRLDALKSEAAAFVCVSDFIRTVLLQRGFPPDKLIVLRNGVDVAPAADLPLDPAMPPAGSYLLFVGRLVAKKGLADLLEAHRRLGDRAPALVVIGEGQDAAVIRAAAAGSSVSVRTTDRQDGDTANHRGSVATGDEIHSGNPVGPSAEEISAPSGRGCADWEAAGCVRFLGWQDNASVRRWMHGALAVCVPSITAASGDSEGLPTVAIEAMAEATPVIGTRHAGIVEAVVDGETGLLVPAGDPAALAAAIAALRDDPDRAAAMGRAGRRRVETAFDARLQSRRLEDLLLSLC